MAYNTPLLRYGMTTIEMLVALLLGGLVIAGTWSLINSSTLTQRVSQSSTDVTLNAMQLNATVGADLDRAGAGLFASYNLSGLNIQWGELSDTLLVLWAESEPLPNSSYQCSSQGTGSCMVLQGDATAILAPGHLVMTGGATTGAALLYVTSVGEPIEAPCGPDCGQERLTCVAQEGPTVFADQVNGSTTYLPDGTTMMSDQPCERSFWPGGAYCVESRQATSVAAQPIPSCTLASGADRLYTEVRFVDRTAEFGYPVASTLTLIPGSRGAPAVRTQRVAFARYFLAQDDATTRLVRQVALAPNGVLGHRHVVVSDVHEFRAAVRHHGEEQFVDGIGVSPSELTPLVANGNFHEAMQPGDRSFSFARSYGTIAAVRVDYSVVARNADPTTGERQSVQLFTLTATPALLSTPR
jgi:hypothetical protein